MKRLLASLACASLALLMIILLHGLITPVEDQVTTLKYRLRGRQEADSNIVIVYIDNDAVKDMGRPVRRNFYALMLKALSELHVAAVGIDVMFEEPNGEYPEYDDLLGATIAGAGRVVLSSYFGTVSDTGSAGPARERGEPPGLPDQGGHVWYGEDFHRPLGVLARAAAGVGHLNLENDVDIPVLVRSAHGVVPAFAAEVLRVSRGVDRSGVRMEDGTVTIGRDLRFKVGAKGLANLNFPGPISSFRSYPFLEVLKSYDALRQDRTPSVPIRSLENKIILISVVAEDHSVYMNTPVSPRYPSVGLQATFLDNALQDRFLGHPGTIVLHVLAFLLAWACAAAILFLKPPLDKLVAGSLLVVVGLLSVMLFERQAYLLPLSPLLMAGVASTVGSMFHQQRSTVTAVRKLQAEKDAIAAELKEKEAHVRMMENELLQLEAAKSSDRTAELLEEIRRYKTEIHALSSRADDIVEFPLDQQDPGNQVAEFEGIVYARPGPMMPAIDFIGKIAGSDAPVLILGESGTGKELVAKAVHTRSQRAGKPFVAVNCGALSEGLLDSELFGHEKGAFTGAVKDRMGRFELAHGGTIFLDEIGEVTEAFQLKLLRVVQEGELERVGGTRTLRVDVRVIAATNRDLKEQVKLRRFREDLFYRLNVLTVALPPLRERKEDIPLLVQHFLRREGDALRISRNVMNALQSHTWKGNVRELESVIKRCALLARADGRTMINLGDLTEEVAAAAATGIALEDQILESLREKGFSRSSVSDTAGELGGLNRGTVAEYLRGQCLRAFVENGFKIEAATQHVSLSSDEEINARVRKKVLEYLSNIAEVSDRSLPWENVTVALRPKTKNLPQRFHPYVEQVAEAYHKGVFTLPSGS